RRGELVMPIGQMVNFDHFNFWIKQPQSSDARPCIEIHPWPAIQEPRGWRKHFGDNIWRAGEIIAADHPISRRSPVITMVRHNRGGFGEHDINAAAVRAAVYVSDSIKEF